MNAESNKSKNKINKKTERKRQIADNTKHLLVQLYPRLSVE